MGASVHVSAVMHSRENRALNTAILVSIALHAALLFGVRGWNDPAKRRLAAPGPIVARLVQPPAVPEPVPAPPAAVKEPAQSPPRVAKPVAAPKPGPVPQAKPQARPAPAAPAPEPAAPSAVPAPAAPAAPGPVAKTEPQPTPSAPLAEPSDSGSLAQYRMELISAAKRYKRYPRVAQDNNWEGEVVVSMAIGANGMIASLSVKSSSGHDALDQQALEMFKRAKPLVPIPAALRGKEFTIELRAIYNLKDAPSS
jgi:protein TonB